MTPRARVVRRTRASAARGARPLKIVVTGPFAAGKTTLIKTISEVAIVGTDRGVSDGTRAVKGETTVALDFGRLTFADDLTLFLFGTPGQSRFEVMWEILSEGMIGFVLLVDATDERSAPEAAHILETFRSYADVPVAVGVTHVDGLDDPGAAADRVRSQLALSPAVPVAPCDPREVEDVKALLLDILFEVHERLDGAASVAR